MVDFSDWSSRDLEVCYRVKSRMTAQRCLQHGLQQAITIVLSPRQLHICFLG